MTLTLLAATVITSLAQDLIKFQGLKDKWGYYDQSKKMGQLKPIIKAQYDAAQSFSSETGLAAVKSGDKWGMIDKTGATIVPFEYGKIVESTVGSMIQVSNQGKKGLIDKSGKKVLSIDYDYIGSPSEEMLPVGKEKKYGFYSMATSNATALKYEQIFVCIDGWFVKQNGKWALIDLNLKELTPFKYDKMSQANTTYH